MDTTVAKAPLGFHMAHGKKILTDGTFQASSAKDGGGSFTRPSFPTLFSRVSIDNVIARRELPTREPFSAWQVVSVSEKAALRNIMFCF